MTENSLHIHIFAVAALGPGSFRGDKMFMEFVRQWMSKGHCVVIYVTEEGFQMGQRYGLNKAQFVVLPCEQWLRISFALHYIFKTLLAIRLALRLSLSEADRHMIYSAGDSLPDVLPAFRSDQRR